jgi:outer membrane autotransporter protein
MAIGADKKLDNDVIIGLAFGYTNSDIEQQDLRAGDESTVKSYQFMAYASKEFGKAYVEGTLAYGMHDIDSTRAAAVGQTAKANIDANQYSARLEAGYRFDLQDKASIIPFASFDYAHLTQDAYTETGADALNLNVDEVTTDRSKLGLGLRLGKQWGEDVGQIQANLKLGVYQYFGGDDADVTAQFAGGGAKFVTPGVTSEETFYNAGLGFKYQVSKTTNIGLNIDYDRSGDGSFNGYSGTFIARKVF